MLLSDHGCIFVSRMASGTSSVLWIGVLTRSTFPGTGIEGAEERAGLLEDIRRISSYACTSTRVGDCHATGDAVWVRFRKPPAFFGSY
jgi:hypothetical protein